MSTGELAMADSKGSSDPIVGRAQRGRERRGRTPTVADSERQDLAVGRARLPWADSIGHDPPAG